MAYKKQKRKGERQAISKNHLAQQPTSTLADDEQKKTRTKGFKNNPLAKLFLGLTIWALFQYIRLKIEPYIFGRVINSCDEDQLLFSQTPGLLEQNKLNSIQAALENHPFLGRNAFVNFDLFGDTEGLVVRFNKDGIKKIQQNNDLQHCSPFVDQVIRNDANAWALRVLVFHPEQDLEGEAIKIHVSSSLGLPDKNSFFPYQVDQLWVSVPPGIAGGHLNIWHNRENPANTPGAEAAAALAPVENTLTTLRGDAVTSVSNYKATAGKLITLILEQYKLEEQYYAKAVEFEVVQVSDEGHEYIIKAGGEERKMEYADNQEF
mmetsp:Transcript_2588/g.4112  ORF Transcript_2588/g.4112 Transcript_2588/m.4112 type:complete len:320 (+) Transcript_2588:82-1041(+)